MHQHEQTDLRQAYETVVHEGREVVFFASPAALRAWLDAHAATAMELYIGFWKVGSGRQTLNWPQAVDEALCVGWIDSVQRRLDDQRHYLRLTPRRRNSVWSAVNVRRVPELQAEGRMTPAGLAVFEATATRRRPRATRRPCATPSSTPEHLQAILQA
jgi:uncharacterized protein YdeI (YjbR/CyaY-like superfamily)